MQKPLPTFRSHLTLALCTVLHGFTHAYGSMLVPLYLQMVEDLHLSGVRAASLVVTLYGIAYNVGSYAAGVLADRFDRKVLLAIGLLGNAAAIVGIGLSRQYWGILGLAVLAGAFGNIFHPAANALAPSHYPKSPGMAIGFLGMGSGLGFFFGPQIAGWRAHSASWHLWNVAQWQKPCVEMGIAGLIVGVIFVVVGADPHVASARKQSRLEKGLAAKIVRLALVLMFRDFAGIAAISLAAIYVERVFRLSVASAGLFVGLMMLPSVLCNPTLVYFSTGRRRLPWLSVILVIGGCVVATTPLWPMGMALPILCLFQTMQLGSYAVSDAAVLERVPAEVRGRVVGIFLLIAGMFGATGPWAMGAWTDWLGVRGSEQSAYFGPFGLLAVCMVVAAIAPRFIAPLGEARTAAIGPAEEISPATMGITGG
jgi:MFS family permease